MAAPVVAVAEEEARLLGCAVVGPEHLLLALCRDEGAAGSALAAAGVRRSVLLERLPHVDPPFVGHLELAPAAGRAVAASLKRGTQLDHREVLRPHLLLAVLDEVGDLLRDLGVDIAALRVDVLRRAGHDDVAGEMERIVYRNASPMRAGDLLRQLRDLERRLEDMERRLGDDPTP